MLNYNRYKKCKSAYENYVVLLEYEKYIQIFDLDAYIIAQIMECIDVLETTDEYETIKFDIDRLREIEEKLRSEHVYYVIMQIDKNNLRKVKYKLKNEYEKMCQSAKINQYIKQKENRTSSENIETDDTNYIKDNSKDNNKDSNKNKSICFSCMKYRSNECFGGKKCSEYRKAPDISKDEMENWPQYGDATYYRLRGYHYRKK